MIIKTIHRRAARYLLIGQRPEEIASRLGVKPRLIRQWTADFEFKKLMVDIERKYFDLLDNDIQRLKRTAISRLQEILDNTETDNTHFEWAVNKVFQITVLRETQLNINSKVDITDGKPVDTPEARAALRALLKAVPDPNRYGKVGEA